MMSDNVVRLPERDREGRPAAEDARQQIRARELAFVRRVKDDIREAHAAGNIGPSFSPRDVLAAAQEIGRLAENCRKAGIKIGEIHADTNLRLDRFKLPPDLDLTSPETRRRCAGRLTKRVDHYLELARHLAGLANEDPEAAQIRVLRNTKFMQSRASRGLDASVEEDPRAEQLVLIHREMAARVVRDCGLLDLFERARRIPGQWNIDRQVFEPSSMACLFQPFYQGCYEVWEEAPPLPGVALARLHHASIEGQCAFVEEGEAPIPVTLDLFREIRLVLGPAVELDVIEPMFESRAYAELRIERSGNVPPVAVRPAAFLERGRPDDPVELLIDGKWRPCILEFRTAEPGLSDMSRALAGSDVNHPFFWPFTPLDEDRQCFEHWYVSWTPVRSDYLIHWLSRSENPSSARSVVPRSHYDRETWFPRPLLAHYVEVAAATGVLELALRSDIALIDGALRHREAEWQASASQATEEMVGRWRSDLNGET